MVDDISTVSQLERYPAIAISPLILVKDRSDLFFLDAILIRLLQLF